LISRIGPFYCVLKKVNIKYEYKNKIWREQKIMKNFKTQKGITLIALVITIIVLLILAGITINLTIGQNGIITTAQQAGKNYQQAAEDEQTQLAEFFTQTDDIINEVYNIGDEVTVGGESFYVLERTDKTESTITLISKYCLNEDATQQETTGHYAVAFSTNNYWNEDIEASPRTINLNEYDAIKNDTGSAVYKANEYAKIIGGDNATGRLLTSEEYCLLWKGNTKMIFISIPEEGIYFGYWLGTTSATQYVMCVYRRVDGNGGTDGVLWSREDAFGVRPVITISKDLLE
jgi:type II secretory pathway pseudopilin PulG